MDQFDERGPGQGERGGVLDRLRRQRPRTGVEKRHLAEDVGRAHHVQHRPLAGRRGTEHRDRAAAQNDQRLARVVLDEQQLALPVGAGNRRRDHPLPLLRLESGEDFHAGQRIAGIWQPSLHKAHPPQFTRNKQCGAGSPIDQHQRPAFAG